MAWCLPRAGEDGRWQLRGSAFFLRWYKCSRDFPGNPVVRTLSSNAWGEDSISAWRTMIARALGGWGGRGMTRESFYFYLFSFIFICWRLITLQYCSGFCHTLTWISHGFTCIPHPDPLSCLPLYPIPLGLPSAPGPSTYLMHPTWAGDLFHPR